MTSDETRSSGKFVLVRPSVLGVVFAASIIGSLWIFSRFPAAVAAALCLLCVWALRGPYWALQALALATFIKFLSPALVAFPAGSGVFFWLVNLVAVARIFSSTKLQNFIRVGPIWAFAGIALMTSIISSPALSVSVMKVLSFAMIVSAAIIGADVLDDDQLPRLVSWFVSLALIVLLLSLATLVRPEVAFLLNGKGLQGILNHPQTLGVVAAPVAAMLLSTLFVQRGGLTVPYVVIAGSVCVTLLLTQARTAAIAALAGLLASMVAGGSSVPTRRREPYAGRLVVVLGVSVFALTAVEYKTGAVGNAIESFVLKRGESSVSEAFLKSRGFGVQSEFQNFLRRPLFGNGFGVYPDGEFPEGVVSVAGIPISAPVEKGFLPTAVLEETGIFGGLALAYVIYSMAIPAWRGRLLPLVAAFFACLFVNIGEENLLSPGGIGLYLWLMIGLAVRNGRCASDPGITSVPPVSAANGESRRFPNLLR